MNQAIIFDTTFDATAAGGFDDTSLPGLLCVDDDPNILDGFRRLLRRKFRVYAVLSPAEGLAAIAAQGPFDIVVSDFKMPGMNGVEFLSQVRTLAPDAVRIMLTAHADFATAMSAVNQANVFRFLLKPCTPFVIEKALEAGLEQRRMLTTERHLTAETLLGCVQALVEVLGLVQPEAFSRANRVRRYVQQIVSGLGQRLPWQLDAASMLSQIGWITLPPDLIAKAAAGQPMAGDEWPTFLSHASAGARILEKIPGMHEVAKIIEAQHICFKDLPFKDLPAKPNLDGRRDLPALGAQLLKAAVDFDTLRQNGLRHEDALRQMHSLTGMYMPEILQAMKAIEKTEAKDEIRAIPLANLTVGMILDDELRSKADILLLGKGQIITPTVLHRLQNIPSPQLRNQMCRVRIRPHSGK